MELTKKMVLAAIGVSIDEDFSRFREQPSAQRYSRLEVSMKAWQRAYQLKDQELEELANINLARWDEHLANKVDEELKRLESPPPRRSGLIDAR